MGQKSIKNIQPESPLDDVELGALTAAANQQHQALPDLMAGIVRLALSRGVDAVIGDQDDQRGPDTH